jgi:hypothetical protein
MAHPRAGVDTAETEEEDTTPLTGWRDLRIWTGRRAAAFLALAFLLTAGAAAAGPEGSVASRSAPKSTTSASGPLRALDVFSDAAGDATGGAPDVTTVDVTSDAAGTITFRVTVGGLPAADTYVDLWIDVDRSSATGDQGVEYNIYLQGSDFAAFGERWSGSDWVDWAPTTARTGFANGVWTLTINRSDLNNTGSFNFYYITSKWSGTTLLGRDDAPDGTAVYTFTLTSSTPGPSPGPGPGPGPGPTPEPEPRTYEDAPNLPSRIRYIGNSIKHVRLGEKMYQTMKKLGIPRVVAVACWSKTDWPSVARSAGIRGNPNSLAGFWLPRQPRWTHVAPKQCADVQALMLSRQPNGQRAYALGTVLHERIHAQGVSNEAQTECYAVQLVYAFARELNFVHTRALRLEQLAVRKSRALAPSGYWNRQKCRDLGAWDLYPEFRNLDY